MIASGNLSDVDDNDRSRVLIRNISMVSRHRGGEGGMIADHRIRLVKVKWLSRGTIGRGREGGLRLYALLYAFKRTNGDL